MSEAPRAIRRALVTGASGALGEAIAERLGRDGVHVVAHANGRIDAARAVAARIAAAGGSAEAVAFDVTDADAARAACERLLEGGPIQIVVNNAGVHHDAVFPGMRAEQWHRVIDVSLHGAIAGAAAGRAAGRGMLASARDVRLACWRLDDLPLADPDVLVVAAERHAADATRILYAFSVRHGGRELASGRVTVVLDAPEGVR